MTRHVTLSREAVSDFQKIEDRFTAMRPAFRGGFAPDQVCERMITQLNEVEGLAVSLRIQIRASRRSGHLPATPRSLSN